MAVNRESRDRLASAVAAYMRGEIGNLALDEVVQNLSSDDETVNHLALMFWFLYDDFKDHPLHITDEGWYGLQRALAFLKTDLELQTARGEYLWFHRKQIEAVILLFACGLGAFWSWGNVWLVLACWLVIGSIWWVTLGRDRNEQKRNLPADVERSFPFDSEAAWRGHQHLLTEFQIPPYDPLKHNSSDPIRHPVVDWMMAIPWTLLSAALVPLWGFLMLLPHRANHYVVKGGDRR